MVKRALIFLHRWIGVALSLAFVLWFPSGIGMMYWTYPTVTAEHRLERSPAIDPETVVLSPHEAAAKLGVEATPGQTRLNTFDGRPVYRFGGGRGGGARLVYADTGEEQTEVPPLMRNRIAAAWTGQPVGNARVDLVTEVDQWTVQSPLRTMRPLWKYSWPNGEQVYVSGESGEVVQYTTTGSRLGAYVSAIPHWFYFTPLRQNQPVWINVVIYSAGIGTILAIAGMAIGVWMYSPSKRYRYAGAPSSIPYHGQKRWHTAFGLIFGLGAVTWAFSGMLSVDPPFLRRAEPAARRPTPTVAAALRGRVSMDDFATIHPRDVLGRNRNLPIKELEFSSFAGEPMFAANLGGGLTRMLQLDGTRVERFEQRRIAEIVRGAAAEPARVETRVIDQYDLYYLDRDRQRPLPVILALMNDAENSRYYIDPKTARVVGSYSNRNWVGRWLYNGLHSLNFPWLYNYRPLWDIVVIFFMVGGTALCVTSLVLSWRVLGRRLATIAPRRMEARRRQVA
jgi:hypothetical protein